MTAKISKKRREEYIRLLFNAGEDRFYQAVIGIGMKQSVHVPNPEDSILNESDALLKLYKATGKEEYLVLCKLLRKAAHVVYWQLIKQDPNKKHNAKRFLTLVS
jgi:hypothetical protein